MLVSLPKEVRDKKLSYLDLGRITTGELADFKNRLANSKKDWIAERFN